MNDPNGVEITLKGNLSDFLAFFRTLAKFVPLAAKVKFLYLGKEVTMLEMNDNQQAPLALAIEDAHGHPASVDGIPVWNSSDEAVVMVEGISTDGMSANVVAKGPGVCQVTVQADADLGAGVIPITGFLDVTIKGGQAVVIKLTAGAPIDQP